MNIINSYVFIIDVADEMYERGFRVVEFNRTLEDVFDIGA
jgi:hypothetical protein